MTSNKRETRTIESMRREADKHTASGQRVHERRPQPRRQGTRAAIVAAARREA